MGLLSDAFYTYGKQEVMRNIGSKEAVNTCGRTAKCRTQQPAQHASKNARAVRVTMGPLPQLLSSKPWRLQHAQGSVRTDWDDPAQAPPPEVHPRSQKWNLNYYEDRAESEKGGRGGGGQGQRGLCPAQVPCCVPNQETTHAGRTRRGWGGLGKKRAQGTAPGPVSGWTPVQLSRAVPLTPSPRWNG